MWQMRCVQALANKIQFGLESVTEALSQEVQKKVGGANPVSPTIMAIILMRPTIPTAYRFSMKMGSHISLSSPHAFHKTMCISWQGRHKNLCVRACMCVQIPQNYMKCDILHHRLHSRGTSATTLSSPTGLSCSLVEL